MAFQCEPHRVQVRHQPLTSSLHMLRRNPGFKHAQRLTGARAVPEKRCMMLGTRCSVRPMGSSAQCPACWEQHPLSSARAAPFPCIPRSQRGPKVQSSCSPAVSPCKEEGPARVCGAAREGSTPGKKATLRPGCWSPHQKAIAHGQQAKQGTCTSHTDQELGALAQHRAAADTVLKVASLGALEASSDKHLQ